LQGRIARYFETFEHAIVQCGYGLVPIVEKGFAQGKKGRVKLTVQFFLAVPVVSAAAFDDMCQFIQSLKDSCFQY
jgi:hypothetical protein